MFMYRTVHPEATLSIPASSIYVHADDQSIDMNLLIRDVRKYVSENYDGIPSRLSIATPVVQSTSEYTVTIEDWLFPKPDDDFNPEDWLDYFRGLIRHLLGVFGDKKEAEIFFPNEEESECIRI